MTTPYRSPCYCTNLRRAAGTVTDFYDNALCALGLTSAQFYLLINLSRVEPVDTTHLAGHVGLERSTLVRNMRILQKNGWVEDLPDSQKHQFQLSQAGRTLLSQAIPLWENAQANFIQQLGEKDALELSRILQKVQTIKRECPSE